MALDGVQVAFLAQNLIYKLRIMTILGKTLRDRPLSALFMVGGAGPMSGIDTVGDGSLLGTLADGSVSLAVGPEMGLGAPGAHP